MFDVQFSQDTDVAAEAIWSRWIDVARWPQWNADIERIEPCESFEVGGIIRMTPRGQDTVELLLAEVDYGKAFVDEATVAGTTIRTLHQLQTLDDGRTRVTYRLRAEGPAEDAIGPAITADFDETISALIEHASR